MKVFNQQQLNLLALGILVSMLVAACETNSGSVVEPQSPEVQQASFTPFKADVELVEMGLRGSSEEKAYVQRLSREASDAISATAEVASESDTWQEADLRVREKLAHLEEHPMRSKVEQIVAHGMLEERLLGTEMSEEKMEAVGFYTRLLVENQNPNASVILPALQVLDGYWDREEVASYAREASQLAEAWLERNPCEECITGSVGKNATADEITDARQRRAYQIQSAVPELKALASTD